MSTQVDLIDPPSGLMCPSTFPPPAVTDDGVYWEAVYESPVWGQVTDVMRLPVSVKPAADSHFRPPPDTQTLHRRPDSSFTSQLKRAADLLLGPPQHADNLETSR